MSTMAMRRGNGRQKILIAIIISLVLHLLTIVGVTTYFGIGPAAPAPAEDAPMELILIDPPAPQRDFVDTNENQVTDKAPEKAEFESDKNTAAASELPATGDRPVPTQEGIDSQSLDFQNQQHTQGREARSASPPSSQPQSAQQAEQDQQQQPKAAEPEATPRPQTDLALLDAPKPKTQPRPQNQEAQKSQSQTPPRPGYQPETRVTKIRGNISNRGRSSVNSVATPLGRYKKMLSDAISSRWYYYVGEQMSLLTTGTVDLKFIVQQDGKVKQIRVERNSSNESFAATSVRAVMDAEIPAIPEDVVKSLQGGVIEIEYSFTIMSN